METFDLELRVETFGSVITWEILLEDSTNHNQRLRDWIQAENYRYKKLPGYVVADDELSVFAGCQGISGGTVNCQVLINGNLQPETLVSKVEETEYAKATYQIE
ncbi:MAG: hypothetical protein ACRYFB_13925 [Janthinobacterium lividum]